MMILGRFKCLLTFHRYLGGDEPIFGHKLSITGLQQGPNSLYLQLFVRLFVIANSSEYVLLKG